MFEFFTSCDCLFNSLLSQLEVVFLALVILLLDFIRSLLGCDHSDMQLLGLAYLRVKLDRLLLIASLVVILLPQ